MGKICVFFGHRVLPDKERIKGALIPVLLDLIQSKGVVEFWLGNYGEFDALAFEVLRDLKKTYPSIRCALALAYLPQKKETYAYQEAVFDEVFCPEGIELGPLRFAICRRNKWLAQNADFVVAYVRASSGGASYALHIAQGAHKTVINLAEKGG